MTVIYVDLFNIFIVLKLGTPMLNCRVLLACKWNIIEKFIVGSFVFFMCGFLSFNL